MATIIINVKIDIKVMDMVKEIIFIDFIAAITTITKDFVYFNLNID